MIYPKGLFCKIPSLQTDIQWGKLLNIKLANVRKQLPQVQMFHSYLAQGMLSALEDGLTLKTQSFVRIRTNTPASGRLRFHKTPS